MQVGDSLQADVDSLEAGGSCFFLLASLLLPSLLLPRHYTFLAYPAKERHSPALDLPYTTRTCLYLRVFRLTSRNADQLVNILSVCSYLLAVPFTSAQMHTSEVSCCLCCGAIEE